MPSFKSIADFLERGDKHFLPCLSIDCVIFGFHANVLKVLLLKPKVLDGWALPGGFIYEQEHIDNSAQRILKERTGLHDIFLKQFFVFGEPERNNNSITIKSLKKRGIDIEKTNWLAQRFVSIGYYALVDFEEVMPSADSISDACEWWDIHKLPPLEMDHKNILEKALYTLRTHLLYHPVGYNLLPKKFTMPELQKLYETILDEKLDRRNFQRKIFSYGILNRLNEQRKGVAHKAPYLYSFNLRKYHKALKNGLQNGW